MRRSLVDELRDDHENGSEASSDEDMSRESRLALNRYRRMRLSSPALWKAATKRAKLVVDSLKKGRFFGGTVIMLAKLIAAEIKEKTAVEPSVQNVRDAITSMILDDQRREHAFVYYDKVLRLYRTFKVGRQAIRNSKAPEKAI